LADEGYDEEGYPITAGGERVTDDNVVSKEKYLK